VTKRTRGSILVKALGAATVLFLLAVGVAVLLPGDYRVERSAVVPAPIAAVRARLCDLSTWPDWSAWSRTGDPSCEFELQPASGAIEWQGDAHGHWRIAFVDGAPNERLEHELASFEGDQAVRSRGTLDLVAQGDSTRVTWTVAGHMPRDPVQRLVGFLMDGALGPKFEASLEGLAHSFSAPTSAE
jgi:hypothetical protein